MNLTIVRAFGMDPNEVAALSYFGDQEAMKTTIIVASKIYPFPGPPWAKPVECLEPFQLGHARVVPVPMRDPTRFNTPFHRNAIWQALRDSQADVVHVWAEPSTTQFIQVATLCRLARRGPKVLFWATSHALPLLASKKAAWWATVGRSVFGGNAVTSLATRALQQSGYPGRLRIVRTFRPCPVAPASDDDGRRVRQAMGVGEHTLVGYVGRIVEEKGLTTLLAALRRLPRIHCVFVGSGPFQSELELLAAGAGVIDRVHFVGSVDPECVPSYLHAMDMLVLPSLTTATNSEQFGRALGEAMACRVPVIGSNSGAIPEVIGDAGIIVREGDHAELSSAIERVATDEELRRQLGARGYDRWRTEFSTEVVLGRFCALYREAVGES